jgi:hypothetical protein
MIRKYTLFCLWYGKLFIEPDKPKKPLLFSSSNVRQVGVVTFQTSSYTINIPLTAYSDENSLENAIASIQNPSGSTSHTYLGLAGAIAVFNSTTLRSGSSRVVVVVVNEDWVDQYKVSA